MSIEQFGGFYASYIGKLKGTLDGINFENVWKAVELIRECKGTVWLIGNGGSASLASHMATDLQLARVRAIALTDVAAVTTYANDNGYQWCFQDQVQRLIKENDVLICISGSGNSKNILNAAGQAALQKARLVLITGFDGGDILKYCNGIQINIPSQHMGISQDGHQIVLHIICYYLMSLKNV